MFLLPEHTGRAAASVFVIAPWQRFIDVDFPRLGPITDELRQRVVKQAHRIRGGSRIAEGRFLTDDDYEQYRREELSTPLP